MSGRSRTLGLRRYDASDLLLLPLNHIDAITLLVFSVLISR